MSFRKLEINWNALKPAMERLMQDQTENNRKYNKVTLKIDDDAQDITIKVVEMLPTCDLETNLGSFVFNEVEDEEETDEYYDDDSEENE